MLEKAGVSDSGSGALGPRNSPVRWAAAGSDVPKPRDPHLILRNSTSCA